MFENSPDKVFTIIHDKMDHSKTTSLHFSHKSKAVHSFMKFPVSATCMIAHGHGHMRYVHHGLDVYKMNSNHTLGSIAQLLWDVESSSKHSSSQLFPSGRSFLLALALLGGLDIYDCPFFLSLENLLNLNHCLRLWLFKWTMHAGITRTDMFLLFT